MFDFQYAKFAVIEQSWVNLGFDSPQKSNTFFQSTIIPSVLCIFSAGCCPEPFLRPMLNPLKFLLGTCGISWGLLGPVGASLGRTVRVTLPQKEPKMAPKLSQVIPKWSQKELKIMRFELRISILENVQATAGHATL